MNWIKNFLNARAWNQISDFAKHFFASMALVILLYGIPHQWFNWNWNLPMQVLLAMSVSLMIGLWWEFRPKGNQSYQDLFVDFLGVIVGLFFCLNALI